MPHPVRPTLAQRHQWLDQMQEDEHEFCSSWRKFSPFDRILTNSVGKPRLEIELVVNPCCTHLDSKSTINRTVIVLDFKILSQNPRRYHSSPLRYYNPPRGWPTRCWALICHIAPVGLRNEASQSSEWAPLDVEGRCHRPVVARLFPVARATCEPPR
jgi:hypothetical protein